MIPRPVLLTRLVRFWISPDAGGPAMPPASGFGGVPAPVGLPAYFELAVSVQGLPDTLSGYLIGIQQIDRGVREAIVPWLAERWRRVASGEGPASADPASLLPEILERLGRAIPVPLREIGIQLTPFHRLSLESLPQESAETTMTTPLRPRPLLRQRFEFSASHRLHCPELSDEENRRTFGKCNHPNGHGHNYRIEVAVELPPEVGEGAATRIEAIVGREVIERFDHRHLNLDTEEFRHLNPSVERIAEVCHGLLEGPIAAIGGVLREVTVWETEKTSCTYPAPPRAAWVADPSA